MPVEVGGRELCVLTADADPTRRWRGAGSLDAYVCLRLSGERLQVGDRVAVARGEHALWRHVVLGVTREEQSSKRRITAVPGAGPPHDGLVLGAGRRDVGEAQVLAAL